MLADYTRRFKMQDATVSSSHHGEWDSMIRKENKFTVPVGFPLPWDRASLIWMTLILWTRFRSQNLRFFYADQAVTTPTNTGVLQVWDCQFYGCDSAINSKASRGCSTNQLHNVLFAECDFAVAAQNDCAAVDAEQVTANVLSFCDTEFYPSRFA